MQWSAKNGTVWLVEKKEEKALMLFSKEEQEFFLKEWMKSIAGAIGYEPESDKK